MSRTDSQHYVQFVASRQWKPHGQRWTKRGWSCGLLSAVIIESYMEHAHGAVTPREETPQKELSQIASIERRWSALKDKTHSYTTHHTYTGPGCAMCGLPEWAHGIALPLIPASPLAHPGESK